MPPQAERTVGDVLPVGDNETGDFREGEHDEDEEGPLETQRQQANQRRDGDDRRRVR